MRTAYVALACIAILLASVLAYLCILGQQVRGIADTQLRMLEIDKRANNRPAPKFIDRDGQRWTL